MRLSEQQLLPATSLVLSWKRRSNDLCRGKKRLVINLVEWNGNDDWQPATDVAVRVPEGVTVNRALNSLILFIGFIDRKRRKTADIL